MAQFCEYITKGTKNVSGKIGRNIAHQGYMWLNKSKYDQNKD